MPSPVPESVPQRPSPLLTWTTQIALAATVAAFLFFFVDRIGCLFPKPGVPYKSAVSGSDNSYYYFWLRAAMVRHDVDFARDVRECATMPEALRQTTLALERTPRGLLPNKYGVGWAVSSVPWYLLGSGVSRVLGLPLDGYGPAYQAALFLGQLVYAVASLVLAWRIALRFVPAPYALPGVLLTWLGSFLVYYQASSTTMAHNIVFFAFALATWAAFKVEEEPGRLRFWVLLGIGAGLAVIARYQAAVLLLHPAAVAVRMIVRRRAGWLGPGVAVAVAGFFLGLQMAAWKALYQVWLFYSYGGETFHWLHAHLWDVLFSPLHGLFYWSPMLLLGTAGFLWLAATAEGDSRRLALRCWLVSGVAMWLVNGAWECWFFGASFGLRAFDGLVLPMMVGLGFLIRAAAGSPWPWLRRGLLLLALLLALLNVNLVYLARKDVLSSERPVTHGEMGSLLLHFWRGR